MSLPALYAALGPVVPINVPRVGPMLSISSPTPAQRPVTSDAAPSAPGSLSASSSAPTTASLTWTQVSGNSGYRIERAAGNGAFSIISTTTTDQNTFEDVGLTTNITYRYRVSTLAGSQVSSASPTASITPVMGTNLAAPQSLSATNPTPTTVRLAWTGTTSTVAVLVQRSIDGGMNWTNLATISGASTTYTDNVQRNTLYAYRLQASSFTATSPFTGSVSLITPPAEVPSFLRTAISKNTAELTWTAVQGATGYVIEQSKETGAYSVLQTLPGGTTRTTISDLENGTVYQYRIRATNAGGSSLSTQVNGVLTITAAPAGLVVVPGDGVTANISFTPTKGASSYILERQSAGRPFSRLATLNASVTTYTDNQIVIGEQYEYRVKAVNGSGDSEYSNVVSVFLTLADTLPTPEDLSLSIGPKNTAILNWTVPTEVGGFVIQRQFGDVWRNVGVTPAEARSFTLKGLSPGQSARFRVLATTSGALGDPSEDILAMTAPANTTGLRSLTPPTDTTVTLTWRAPRGATSYTVQRSSDSGATFSTIASGFPAAGYVDSTVAAGQIYAYRVFGSNDAGAGATSPTVFITTRPSTPGNIAATPAVAPAKGAVVTWADVAGETGYRIQGSIDGVRWSNTATARPNVTSVAVRNPKLQFFRVAAQNRSGVSPFSSAVTFPEVVTASSSTFPPIFSKTPLSSPQTVSDPATDLLF